MAVFTGITFNEVAMPGFVRVKGIEHRILPSISQTTQTIGGRAGAYDFGNTIGSREINIDIMIIADQPNMMPTLLSELATWLYYEDAQELVLGDNPGKYYIAKLSGDTDISEDFKYGEGTLTFICNDPYIYEDAEKAYTIQPGYDGSILEVTNDGKASTYPELAFSIIKDTTNFAVVADDEFIEFGTPFDADEVDITVVDAGGYVMKDHCNSLAGWSDVGALSGATVSGTLEVYDNGAFRQSGLEYGKVAGWHGAGMVKPLANEVTDFEAYMKARISTEANSPYMGTVKTLTAVKLRAGAGSKYKVKKTTKKGETYNVVKKVSGWYKLSNGYYCPSSKKQVTFTAETYKADKMGKYVMSLMTASNTVVCSAYIYDATAKSRTLKARFRLSNAEGAKALIDMTIPSQYLDMDGYWNVKKKGKVWTVELWAETSTGKYKRIGYKKYTDTKGAYTRKPASARIAVLGYSSNPVCYMSIKEFHVKSLDKTVNDSTEIPLILRAGDVLSIDNETGTILKNGTAFYEYLNPASSFIKLEPGANGIIISPSDAFENGTIIYSERSL